MCPQPSGLAAFTPAFPASRRSPMALLTVTTFPVAALLTAPALFSTVAADSGETGRRQEPGHSRPGGGPYCEEMPGMDLSWFCRLADIRPLRRAAPGFTR
jgi:hypothetical protein